MLFSIDMYDKLISLENLFLSWNEFKREKQNKIDVHAFERFLEDNIFALQEELRTGSYRHGKYKTFFINDPKPRIISKPTVKDRIVHHAVFKELENIFDPGFIYHSYSSRKERGTHLAVNNLAKYLRRISKNYHCPVYALKCDIRKFFASIEHEKLLQLIKRKISDERFLGLIKEVVDSFSTPIDKLTLTIPINSLEKRGIPLGNVTSQIFANIYLNELDWFIKRKLKAKNYFRYADDLIIVRESVPYLENVLKQIDAFLKRELKLELHPRKVEIRKFQQGLDFLGYVVLPHHIVLRTKTKRRMLKKIKNKYEEVKNESLTVESFNQTIQSYSGMLAHCNGKDIKERINRIIKG